MRKQKAEHSIYICCNEFGEVESCNPNEAEAVLVVMTVGDQIVHGHLELLYEDGYDDDDEHYIKTTDEDRQLDLLELLERRELSTDYGMEE